MATNVRGTKVLPIGGLGKTLYATANGLRVGARGRVELPGVVLGRLDKGRARQVRKALRRAGLRRMAGAERIAS